MAFSVCTGSPFSQVLSSGGCRRGFLAKYFSCASRSTCVSAGSRLLSGKTRTTGEFASASLPGTGSSDAVFSRKWALVFSQKICAVVSPPFALANKEPAIVALASATPRSSSSRKRLRRVFGAQPMILAMSS
jgi:hypothetical protein